jgi:antitoxin component YwqK of YwqJK toxin-antitoxin module
MTSQSNAKSGLKGRIILGAGLIVVGLGIMAYFSRQQPKVVIERERSQLELKQGKLYLTNSEIPFTGQMVEHYPGGQIQSRTSVQAGLLDGASWGYYTNGQAQVEEHFSKGVSEGTRTKWYPSGAKMSEATIHAGALTGTYRRWYEKGGIAEVVQMDDGVAHGPSVSYYPSGFLKAEATLDRGKLVQQKFWKDGEGKRLESGATNPAG